MLNLWREIKYSKENLPSLSACDEAKNKRGKCFFFGTAKTFSLRCRFSCLPTFYTELEAYSLNQYLHDANCQ
jgi:hypothetical protein